MSEITGVAELFGAPAKRRFKVVSLPVSGHVVRIRSLTEKDFADYQAFFLDKKGNAVPARLKQATRVFISMCAVDGDGNRIITGDLVERLSDWDAADSHHLYNECSQHAGISTDDIEGLVKNLETTPDDSTPTD
jgi:hypothetical protein